MDNDDFAFLQEDLQQHLQKAYIYLNCLAEENIATVQQRRATHDFRDAFFELNVRLTACLDYIATYISKNYCINARKPYFLCCNKNMNPDEVEKILNKEFPNLFQANRTLFDFLKYYQSSMHTEGQVLEELRESNNSGKHRQLIPPKEFTQLKGTTIQRISSQPIAPPLWIWARGAILGPQSHLLGGNGSMLGFGSLKAEKTADILGIPADIILQGKSTNEVRIYPFLCLWFADGISKPILQFAGTATNLICEIVLNFLNIVASEKTDAPQINLPVFHQLYVDGYLTNNGTITTY